MSILNVVQPDELDPSSFSLVDGKLKVAISSLENNILQYKSDGLYASTGGGDGVPGRYIYTTDEFGYVQHKGINFDIQLIDGALSGQIYGIDSANGLSPDDMIFYEGVTEHAMSDDSKYLIQMPWALEDLQRFVLKMFRNDETVFWVVRVIGQSNDREEQNGSAIVIIDEMINVDGSLPDDEEEVVEPGMMQALGLFKFEDGLATLVTDEDNGLSLFRVNYDGATDPSFNLLPEDYRKTTNNFVAVSQLYNVAIWTSPENRIIFAEFTNGEVTITDIGDSTTSIKNMTVTKDTIGNYLIRREGYGGITVPTVIKIATDGTVSNYEYPDLLVNGYNFHGTTILGDKLLVFEESTGYGKQIRVVNALTGDVLTQGRFDYGDRIDNTVFQIVDNDTLVIIDRGNTNQKLNVSLVKVTNSEVSLIKKITLDFYDRYAPNGKLSSSMTFASGDNTVSYRVAVRGDVGYYVKITASATDFQVQEQEITPNIAEMAVDLVSEDVSLLPMFTLINDGVGYIQYDGRLSGFNTFPLDMVEHDTTPRAAALSAAWNEGYGVIEINGRLDYIDNDVVNYAHLEVETPSGQIHTAKYRIGTKTNGEVKRTLGAIAEPGEYIFRLRHWDGGKTLEARATVPAEGKDFRAPIVTPVGDGEWLFSTENTEAGERGVYNVYRSRHPVSIIEDFDRDGYVYNNIHTTPPIYRIPSEERNGIWYIIVGHSGVASETIWTPTFFTYGE